MTEQLNDLNPLSPEVIKNQATINIGTIGHVAHGKSTVVKAISGVQTVRFKKEFERNITIKLGYANAKIYKCEKCPRPSCYKSYGSGSNVEFCSCGGKMELIRHVSFVDCPGHDVLMSTMLSGAAVMDAALLLIAANEYCPQPQTKEHLASIEIMQLENLLILQNKIDLVKEDEAKKQYGSILAFTENTKAQGKPIIPISAQLRYNIDVVNEYICTKIPMPLRDFSTDPRLIIIRSFDVNRPGTEINDLKGGVAGGSILQGILKLNDEIEIRPGLVSKNSEGQIIIKPLYSKIVSLAAESNSLEFAVPGGLIGVGTRLDPYVCRGDRLVGKVLGSVGKLPNIFGEIEIKYFLLRRLLGVQEDGKAAKISKLMKNETLLLNIGSTSTGGKVLNVKNDMAKIFLINPCCAEVGDKLAISRRIDKNFRLIGWGTILRGAVLESE